MAELIVRRRKRQWAIAAAGHGLTNRVVTIFARVDYVAPPRSGNG